MIFQRTLARDTQVTGIGLHSGKKVTLHLYPAPADSGIVFKRTDIPNAVSMKADALSVGATENNTTLGTGGNVVHTVEHLLAALYGLGIDNCYCEISGPEIPIMDGSSGSFIFLLKEAGTEELSKLKKFIIVKEKVRVEEGDKWAEISPSEQFTIDSTIVFAHPVIKRQVRNFTFSCDNFVHEIGRARTFGLLRDVDNLKRKGLVKGGSLDNAIVLDDYKVVNAEGLRFKDEFVRHKVLDTIGDFSLLGHELVGHIQTYKSGHSLHNKLCRKLLNTPRAYEVISADSVPKNIKQLYMLPQANSFAVT